MFQCLLKINPYNILAESMSIIGYKSIKISAIRKRNTKKGLIEFNVKACWA